VGYFPVDSVNIEDQEQFKRTLANVRNDSIIFPRRLRVPLVRHSQSGIWSSKAAIGMTGAPVRPVDLNYGRVRAELGWHDSNHCFLRSELGPDERNSGDLTWGGRRAVLGVHRYIGRVAKIRGVERSEWLGHLLVAYCAHGGPREYALPI